MKTLFALAILFFVLPACTGQTVSVKGIATDSSNGAFVVEIVVNDTLSKIMKDPKNGRSKYLRLYHDPKIVTRTDSTGTFAINARMTDSLYFKSYQHVTESYLVKDLINRNKIFIRLKPEITKND